MFYWTPVKTDIPQQCTVCRNYYKGGYRSLDGEFYCAKDKRERDATDLSIGRISIWKREDTPLVIQTETLGMSVLTTDEMNKTEWIALVPIEILDKGKQFLAHFNILGEVITSKGVVYLLSAV